MNSKFSTIDKQITAVDSVVFEASFFESLNKEKNTEEMIGEWYAQLSRQHFNKMFVQPVLKTYWRWYVRACWLYMDGISPNVLPDFISPTITSAVSCEFSCLDLYVAYLANVVQEDSEINTLHTKLSVHVRSSNIPLSFDVDNAMTLGAVCLEVENNFARFDSLKKAEFISRVQYELFEKNSLSLGDVSSERKSELVTNFFDLLQFILTIKDASSVVARYREQTKKVAEDGMNFDVDVAGIFNDLLITTGREFIPPAQLLAPFNVFEYFDVFDKKDTTHIIQELDIMATERQESRIRDVYFYNEATGKFEWDEKLLRELKLVPDDFDMSTVKI